MNLVRNERTELLATYLNGAAIAAVVVGGFSRLIAAQSLGLGLAAWIILSLVLHLTAQAVLGRLRE